MQVQNLVCNACGAPLEVPESANFVTCNHCSSRLAIRRTESSTFTEQLEQLVETTDRLSNQIGELNAHNELATIDREWRLERENYKVSGKDGHRAIPSKGESVVGGVVITVFGCFWTAMAFGVTSAASVFGTSFGPPPIVRVGFPLFGILFVVGGIFKAAQTYSKATDYEAAEKRYRRRRQQASESSQ